MRRFTESKELGCLVGGEAHSQAHGAEEEPGDEVLPNMGDGGDGSCGRAAPSSGERGEEEGAMVQADCAATSEHVPDSSCRSSNHHGSDEQVEHALDNREEEGTMGAGGSSFEARCRDEGAGTSPLLEGASMQGSGAASVFDCVTASRRIPGAADSQHGNLAEAHEGRSHVPGNADAQRAQEQQGSLEGANSPASAPAGCQHAPPGTMSQQGQQQLHAHHWPSRLDTPKNAAAGHPASGLPAAAAAVSNGLLGPGGVATTGARVAAGPAASLARAAPAQQAMPPSGQVAGPMHDAAQSARQPTSPLFECAQGFQFICMSRLCFCFAESNRPCLRRKIGRPVKPPTTRSRLKDAFLRIYRGLRKAMPDAVTPFLVRLFDRQATPE